LGSKNSGISAASFVIRIIALITVLTGCFLIADYFLDEESVTEPVTKRETQPSQYGKHFIVKVWTTNFNFFVSSDVSTDFKPNEKVAVYHTPYLNRVKKVQTTGELINPIFKPFNHYFVLPWVLLLSVIIMFVKKCLYFQPSWFF